jgi:hypothetical protein
MKLASTRNAKRAAISGSPKTPDPAPRNQAPFSICGARREGEVGEKHLRIGHLDLRLRNRSGIAPSSVSGDFASIPTAAARCCTSLGCTRHEHLRRRPRGCDGRRARKAHEPFEFGQQGFELLLGLHLLVPSLDVLELA